MKIPEVMQSFIEIGDIHADRLEKALRHISHRVPFQALDMNKFADDELSYMEMMTSRFAKLQDILGAKVFPLLLQHLQESRSDDSGLDRLHKLEKLGILPSAQEWIMMRELRNHITHEYPDNPELMASNLNKTVEYAKKFMLFWQQLKATIKAIP